MLTSFSKKGTKRNKAAVILNQQNHKFCVTNKSQYHTLQKLFTKKIATQSDQVQNRETEGSLIFIKPKQTITLTKMHNLSELEQKRPQCIQHATVFHVTTLMLCKLKS